MITEDSRRNFHGFHQHRPMIRCRNCQNVLLCRIFAFGCPCEDSSWFAIVDIPILILSFIDTSFHRSLLSILPFLSLKQRSTFHNALFKRFLFDSSMKENSFSQRFLTLSKPALYRHLMKFLISKVKCPWPRDTGMWRKHSKWRFRYLAHCSQGESLIRPMMWYWVQMLNGHPGQCNLFGWTETESNRNFDIPNDECEIDVTYGQIIFHIALIRNSSIRYRWSRKREQANGVA
jgi:hypothetical protein